MMKKLIALFTKKEDKVAIGAKGYLVRVEEICSDFDKLQQKVIQKSVDNR
jgi:hypothetical protein